MSNPLSPEAVELWKLLAHIESASQEKAVRDVALKRLEIGRYSGDVLVAVEKAAVDAPKMKWSGTGWVADAPPAKLSDYATVEKVAVGRVEGNFVPPQRTLQPEELPGSPHSRIVGGAYHEPSPTRPQVPQAPVFSPEHALALAQAQQAQRAAQAAPAPEGPPQIAPAALAALQAAQAQAQAQAQAGTMRVYADGSPVPPGA